MAPRRGIRIQWPPKDLSRVFCNLMHPFYKPGAQILVIGAQGAHEYGAVRNNVGGVSRIKRTQGKTCLLAWITLPGYEILEGAVNMKAHIDGINTQMRHGAVAAHTFTVILKPSQEDVMKPVP